MTKMNLVTGYIGSNHVTAIDAGSFNAGIVGDGQYILERGQKLSANVISNNKIRIFDGDLVMQGRHVRINTDDYVDLTIENGATNYNRNDLIVARYTKDASTSVEVVELVVIKGTAVTGTAVDPVYTSGDITKNDVALNEMPLYRVRLEGLNIVAVELLAEEVQNLKNFTNHTHGFAEFDDVLPVEKGGTDANNTTDARKKLGAAKIEFVPVTFMPDKWSSEPPYQQVAIDSKFTFDAKPFLFFRFYDGIGDVAADKANFAKVDRVETADGMLFAYCYTSKPDRAIPGEVMLVR